MSVDVKARCERSGDWWAVEVPEIPGLFTQVKRLDQVPAMVRDAASMLDVEVGDVEVVPVMDEATECMVRQMVDARDAAGRAQERASKAMRNTVSVLRGEGLTVRDVATVVGISPQRVSVLQKA